MKHFLFTIVLLFFLPITQAQNAKSSTVSSKKTADSLMKAGVLAQDNGEYKQSLMLFEKSLNIYKDNNDIKEIGDCYANMANTYYFEGNYNQALNATNLGLKEYKKINYYRGISASLNNFGIVYIFLGNYPKALEYFKQAIVILQKINDTKVEAAITQNIGGIYEKVGDQKNNMKYLQRAYVLHLKNKDREGQARVLNSIGFSFLTINDFANAEKNLNESYAIGTLLNSKQILVEVMTNLAELYFRKSDYQKSLFYLNLALKYALETNSLQYITESKISIGNIKNRLGENKKAIELCKDAFKLAEEIGATVAKKNACKCLYEGYKAVDNTTLALLYYEKSNVFQDSLQFKETANQVMDMEFQNTKLLDSISNVKKAYFVQLKHKEEVAQQQKQRNIIILSLLFILIFAVALWSRLRFVSRSKKQLQVEKDRSEKLLLNILPAEIAEELKQNGSVNAKDFNSASILFTDFKSFTQTAESMTPQDLVEEINVCFKAFDEITEFYKIEKIKTIGDAYMAAGGIPVPDKNSLLNIVLAGLEMQEFVTKRKLENDILNKPSFEMRLGIHAGPIIAGIVGIKKFQYDVWGDTVNTASRLESNGKVGKVNISESLYQHIKDLDLFTFEHRGKIDVKGKGEINMYFVEKQ